MRIKAISLILLVILLQACAAAPLGLIRVTQPPAVIAEQPSPAAPTATSPPSPTPSSPPPAAILLPASTSAPTSGPPTPTPALEACLLAGGRVVVSEFTTTLLPDPLIYRIYLPPCYDVQLDRSYPVLYLVHGLTNTDDQWDRLGVPETADQLIRAGEVGPFIVVMPRDRLSLEPTLDNFGTAVQQSLVPWIDHHYRTIPDREHRAIGGLSRGAAWAVHIGLSRPDLFSRVGVHSGFVFFSDNQELYSWLHDPSPDMIPHIYMDVGDHDRPEIANGSAWLENYLTSFDIPHEWHLYTGEHNEAYWQAHIDDYLRWYTQDWGN